MMTPPRLLALMLAVSFLGSFAHADSLTQPQRVSIAPDETLPVADRIIVHKAQRRLDLMHGYTVLRSYRVELGLNPIGQKERSGDFRTPEGVYYLSRRNARSDFFLSVQVS